MIVQGNWERNGTQLQDNSDGRITVTNDVMGTPPYQITVRLDPMDYEDAGTYNCLATVTPQDPAYITGPRTPTSNQRTVSVQGMFIPLS